MTRPGPQPAYVLHHWAWSETSLILDLFTRELGRIAVVAKGAKRPYSQLRSVLLPFQRILVTLGRQPSDAASSARIRADEGGDILTLRTAEFAGGATLLPPERLFSGFYLNELLMKLLARHDAHSRLFDAYGDSLVALAATDDRGDEVALRAFELTLLRETGVLPELNRNTQTQQALLPQRGYVLHAEAGLVAAGTGDVAISAAHCEALQAALQANDAAALRTACAAVLPALKNQLRALLHYHLGATQLRTRQAMLELRRLLDTPPDGAVE